MVICWRAWHALAVVSPGAGTIQAVKKTTVSLDAMKKEAAFEEATDTEYKGVLQDLKNFSG